MKRMSVGYGICIALLFTIAAILASPFLVFFHYDALRFFISALVIGYTILIIPRSERRSGRIFACIAVCCALAVLFIAAQHFSTFLLSSAGLLWGVRALLLGRSILHIALDGALILAAMFVSLCAGAATHSLAFGIWTFFLTLAAEPIITAFASQRKNAAEANAFAATASRFESAYQCAEHALTALARR